ncbi:hypothetical protein NYE69_06870 [Paenibacillus sp. FSL R5-0527]|uniref:hypothetical protein n=1 Tax=Paenibacillus sp. FSL R5-0527 TaxID=2975321 RepID=UPI00097AA807|nr:hypothetical protein BK140_09285 [Paenibacillus macerans]
MNARIAELKKLHVWSKPELALAIKNTEHHMKTSNLQPKTTHTIQGLIMACKSYDEVIDELFAEIERQARDINDRDFSVSSLEHNRKLLQEENGRLRKALEEAWGRFKLIKDNRSTRSKVSEICDAATYKIEAVLGEGDPDAGQGA